MKLLFSIIIIVSTNLLSLTTAWVCTGSSGCGRSVWASPRACTALDATRLAYSSDVSDVSTAGKLPSWFQRLRRRFIPDKNADDYSTTTSTTTTPTIPGHHDDHPRIATMNNQKEQTSKAYQEDMPWTESIRPDDCQKLTYMPFRNWQMDFMQENLTNLRELPVKSRTGRDMSYIETPKRTHRMHTSCYESDEYKLIRLTTLDAGKQTQVFTSLWYPRDSLTPVLGIDLLQFGQRHLCIVDFQPVTTDQPEEQARMEKEMAKIRDKYPSLQGKMTDRFYSADDIYFSKQMLLGRHDHSITDYTADELVSDLMAAFQKYVQLHRTCVEHAPVCDQVEAYHQLYDTYSAARDPAHHLLARIFGQEWADGYVYDVLFPGAQQTD